MPYNSNFEKKLFLDFNDDYFIELIEFVFGEWICWRRHNNNPGYQVQCITNVDPGGSANHIAVFTPN